MTTDQPSSFDPSELVIDEAWTITTPDPSILHEMIRADRRARALQKARDELKKNRLWQTEDDMKPLV